MSPSTYFMSFNILFLKAETYRICIEAQQYEIIGYYLI